MHRKLFILLGLFFCLNTFGQTKIQQPNILFILGDDLTFSDIEPYGNTQVHTPNLTRLAKQGMSFDNMFTSTAMCAPTRQQLMTGLYPVRNGAYPNHSQVYEGTRSIAHYLQEVGYNAGQLGKKHFGPESSFPYELLGGKDHDAGKGQDIDLQVAEQFIRRSGKKPFFLMITPNQSHTPWNRGDASKYPPSKLKLPPGFEDTKATRLSLSKYYAEITYLDSLVGVCLDMLDRTGQTNNTLVVFSSEQGSSFPFAKWTCYDQGLKTAFIAKWPGKIKPATRNNALVQYVDVVPTLLEIAGKDPSKINTGNKDADGYEGFDGRSFAKVLRAETNEFRSYVFGVHTTRGIIGGSDAYAIRSARNKEFLYIHNLNFESRFSNVLTGKGLLEEWDKKSPQGRAQFYEIRPEEELYDVIKDPYQLNNLAGNQSLAAIKSELKSQLANFMKQQGDQGKATEMKAFERQHNKGEQEN